MRIHPLAATAIRLFAAGVFLYAICHSYHLWDMLAKNQVIAAQALTTFRYSQVGETNDDAR